MTADEAHELLHRDYRDGKHPILTKGGSMRAKYKGSGLWDDITGLAGKIVHEFVDPDSTMRKKVMPVVAKYGKYLDYIPGLEGVGTAVSTGAKLLATEGGSRVVGAGAEHMMSPQDAKQLVMMDFRGGRHPYLTKGGAVRSHLKGSGIWDNIKGLAKKAANELVNPDSVLRKKVAPAVAKYAKYGDYVVPGVGTAVSKGAESLATGEVGKLASQAGEAYSAYQGEKKQKKRETTGNILADIAQRGIQAQLAEAQQSAPPRFAKPYAAPPKEDYSIPNFTKNYNVPNFTTKFGAPAQKPKGVKDSNGAMLAIADEDDDAPILLRDWNEEERAEMTPKPPAKKSRVEALQAKFAAQDAARGKGTPDFATLSLLRKGAKAGGARPKRTNKRAQIVGQVMRERGVSLPEASRIVKSEGLY